MRTLLRILDEKGHVRHRQRGREYVYRPIQPRNHAGASAVRRVLKTFFEGSLEQAVAVHLSDPETAIDPGELKRLEATIREARRQGR